MEKANLVKFDQNPEESFLLGQQLLKSLPENNFNKVTRVWIRNELTKGNDFERAKDQIMEEYDTHAKHNLKVLIKENIGNFTSWYHNSYGDEGVENAKTELETFTRGNSEAYYQLKSLEREYRDHDMSYRGYKEGELKEKRIMEDLRQQKIKCENLDVRKKGLLGAIDRESKRHKKEFDALPLKDKIENIFTEVTLSQETIKSFPDLNDISLWCADIGRGAFGIMNGIEISEVIYNGAGNMGELYYLCAVEIMDNATIVYEDLEVYAHDVIPERVIKSINKAKALGAKEFQVAYPIFDFVDVSGKEIVRQDELKKASSPSQNQNSEVSQTPLIDPIVVAVSGETMFYIDKWD